MFAGAEALTISSLQIFEIIYIALWRNDFRFSPWKRVFLPAWRTELIHPDASACMASLLTSR